MRMRVAALRVSSRALCCFACVRVIPPARVADLHSFTACAVFHFGVRGRGPGRAAVAQGKALRTVCVFEYKPTQPSTAMDCRLRSFCVVCTARAAMAPVASAGPAGARRGLDMDSERLRRDRAHSGLQLLRVVLPSLHGASNLGGALGELARGAPQRLQPLGPGRLHGGHLPTSISA